jgi:hypothetical protein
MSAELDKEKAWQDKVIEMDRLCRLHLDVPYDACAVQGHYLFIKLAPVAEKLPLKTTSGVYTSNEMKKNDINTGLVLGMGRYAFEDGVSVKWTHGPLCQLGDTIGFFKAEFVETLLNGYPVGYIRDTNVFTTTKLPHLWGSYSIGRSARPREANKIIYNRKDLLELGLECSDPLTLFRDDFEKSEGDAR